MEQHKYLGLWCSNNTIIFVKNHSYLAEQAGKAISTIINYSHNIGHLTPKLSLNVLQSPIEPILMYGSEVLFSDEEISEISEISLRRSMSHFWNTCLESKNKPHLLLSMGIQKGILFILTTNTSVEILDLLLFKSWYLRIMYNSLASLDFIGEINWCSHIRSLLFRTNHHDVWRNHRVENANLLIK